MSPHTLVWIKNKGLSDLGDQCSWIWWLKMFFKNTTFTIGEKIFKWSKPMTILWKCMVFKDLILRWPRWWCCFNVSRFNVDEKDATNPCEYGFRPMPSIKIFHSLFIVMIVFLQVGEAVVRIHWAFVKVTIVFPMMVICATLKRFLVIPSIYNTS